MRLEFHPDTAKDVQDAVSHFENQRPGLADAFQLQHSEALDRICASPSRFQKIEANIRRCLVHRFPYSISVPDCCWQKNQNSYYPPPSSPS